MAGGRIDMFSTLNFYNLSGQRCFIFKDKKQNIKHWIVLFERGCTQTLGECLDFIFLSLSVMRKVTVPRLRQILLLGRSNVSTRSQRPNAALLCSHTDGRIFTPPPSAITFIRNNIFLPLLKWGCHIIPPSIGFATCCLFHFNRYFLAWEREREVYHVLVLFLSKGTLNIQ